MDFAKKLENFFADPKNWAQELSNDVSFVIFGHQTWDLEGGGVKLTPPQHILVFKYPSRDRVKMLEASILKIYILMLDMTIYSLDKKNQYVRNQGQHFRNFSTGF